MTPADSNRSTRIRAVQAWLDSLPRSVPAGISEHMVQLYGTRKLSNANPFADHQGRPTFEVLIDSLPREHQAAIRRRSVIRGLCIACALGNQVDLAKEFAADLSESKEKRHPGSQSRSRRL